MTHFSCVLIGNESLLAGCGDMLVENGHTIDAVVSRNPALRDWAEERGLAVLADVRALPASGRSFDWLFSIANLDLLPPEVLALPARGTINFHDGPLPEYAGLNAPAWAVMNRRTAFGVSWHMIEGGIDEGDIVAGQALEITADDTAFTVNSRCYGAAMESFAGLIADLARGAPQRTPQDLSARSYFARTDRPENMAMIDFNRRADEIVALVRGLDFGSYWNPLALPKLDCGGRVVTLRAARIQGPATDAAPGTTLAVAPDSLTVATATAPVVLERFADAMGGAVDMTALTGAGSVLRPRAVEGDVVRRAADGDAFWRAEMGRARPVRLALARPGNGTAPDWQSRTLPSAAQAADRALAVLAWAAMSGGGEGDTVAFATPVPAGAEGLLHPWAPMQVDMTMALITARARAGAFLARVARHGGFACDLLARDAELASPERPDIGLSTDAAPLAGCALSVGMAADGLVLHHDRNRIDDATADILADRLIALLARIAGADADAALRDLCTLPEAEHRLMLETWNRTAAALDGPQTLPALFEAQVARSPEAVALVFEDESLSYRDLNARANRIAHRLREMGVAPGSHVGLYMPRAIDLLAGALGILKAGGAYVPLDPAYPADRIAHYITDSGAQVIVTRSDMAAGLPEGQASLLALDRDAGLATASAENPAPQAGPDDAAYLIYTSGSTGLPKGVTVEHRNVANFFAGMDAHIDHEAGGVWLAVTSLAFDISVLELFYTLARGFKVILSSDENRAVMSNGPIAMPGRRIEFNLFYWGNDDGVGRDKYKLLLEGAKFADAHGFNAVWTPERHFHAFGGPYPNPSVTGAAVAAVTRNLSVRAGSCVAPLHHPARIAEEWAVIDNLTNGRAGLAIASGWQPDDFVLRPQNTPPANKPAMYEAIDHLRALWRGEAVGFPRADGSLHALVTQPRPVSAELPIWVTTAGNPETWREAGEIGAHVLTHLLGQTIDEVAGKIRIYHDALRKAGHDPADFQVTMMLHTYIASSREAARATARGPMKDYLRSAAGLIKQYAWAFPAFKRPAGINTPFEMDLGTLGEEELDAILDFAFERYFEDAGLFGTVEDGVARAEQLKRIGVTEVACLIDYGIPGAEVMAGLRPLAEVLARANAPTELAPDDFSLAAQMVRHAVTHLQCTPSMARLIAGDGEARMGLGRLRQLMVGGEALPGALAADLVAATANGKVLNMYGPTETTIWSAVHPVNGDTGATVPLGRPIANTTVHVLDPAGALCPVGVPGELLIGGKGVARGYWQRPDLNAERFVTDPTGGGRLYRTGDLVAWSGDGTLVFFGRTDHQVKIRGQRIELGEIEARIEAFPGIAQAVVVAREMAPGDTRLVAYVRADAGLSETALRAALSSALPEVMVPAHIVTLDRFPLTPNKKVDRKALPAPQPARDTAAAPRPPAGAAPDDSTEQAIAAIWSRILGVSGIRADDNFFALGGHSLLAVQAHRALRSELDAPTLAITDIFRFPTLKALAAHLGGGSATTNAPAAPTMDATARGETMSRRRAMRAERGARA